MTLLLACYGPLYPAKLRTIRRIKSAIAKKKGKKNVTILVVIFVRTNDHTNDGANGKPFDAADDPQRSVNALAWTRIGTG